MKNIHGTQKMNPNYLDDISPAPSAGPNFHLSSKIFQCQHDRLAQNIVYRQTFWFPKGYILMTLVIPLLFSSSPTIRLTFVIPGEIS